MRSQPTTAMHWARMWVVIVEGAWEVLHPATHLGLVFAVPWSVLQFAKVPGGLLSSMVPCDDRWPSTKHACH